MMDVRYTIECKGTMPGTSKACRATLCETDGTKFFTNGDIILEIDPPRVKCSLCGYETNLRQYLKKLDIMAT